MTPRGGADRNMDRSPEAKQAFALLLKEAREKLGMNKTEMARELGLDMKIYWLYEAAKTLPQTTEAKEQIINMAQALLAELKEQEEVVSQETEVAINSNKEPQETPEVAPVEKSPQAEEREPILREPLYEDKSVMEQLQDLGVEVVTVSKGVQQKEPHPANKISQLRWYNSAQQHNEYLNDKINITPSCISVGSKAAQKLGGDGVYVTVGCADKDGAAVPVFQVTQERQEGALLLSSKANKNTRRIGSRASIKWLQGEGVKLGRYELKRFRNVENVFYGVPAGDK